jgi:hypothetical protein
MNILLLSNNSPGYHKFYNILIKNLKESGHTIFIACDSNYSKFANQLDLNLYNTYVFTDFIECNQPQLNILNKYKDYNLNNALISDIERSEYYDINSFDYVKDIKYLQSYLLNYYEYIFASAKIDIILYEEVSNSFAYYAWITSQYHQLRYIGIRTSRIPGRFSFVSNPNHEHKKYESSLDDIIKGKLLLTSETILFCESYINNIDNIVPDYMSFGSVSTTNFLYRYFSSEKLRKLSLIIKLSFICREYYSYQVGNPFKLSFNMVTRNFYRLIKLPFVKLFYRKFISEEQYFLYPLHFHPESSTSVQSSEFLNEYELIKNIAFNLPINTHLYVKDHPSAYAYPNLSFYKSISKLPNVRLLSPFEDTKFLIKNSIGVITQTSTIGYEALLLNKYVFLFGNVFYQYHKNIVEIDNPKNLFELLSKAIKIPIVPDFLYNRNFVASYYINTYPGIINYDLDTHQLAHLVEQIVPVINTEIAK